ncbi:MAG: hypothetical protein OEY34_05645, partial [Cyclobacteriaceae bacterium]|nr:hypothetical protein [Cyclobacteriaceae bacterium]
SAMLPEAVIKRGLIYYSFQVENQKGEITTYPEGNAYNLRIVPPSYPIHLFDASSDVDVLVRPWRNGFRMVPTSLDGELGYQMNIEKLFVPDNENKNAEPLHVYSFKHFLSDRIEGRKKDLAGKENIVFKGSSLNDKPCLIEIALIMKDGSAFGKVVEVGTALKEYRIALSDLKPVQTVTLPRPYPTFLPYYFEHRNTGGFRIEDIESIQFSIGPGIPKAEQEQPHGIEIVKVRLE